MAARSIRHNDEPLVRRATNVSLDMRLVETAKELGINLSRACEAGLAKQVSEKRSRCWLEENQAAIEASNGWVAEHGLRWKSRLAGRGL